MLWTGMTLTGSDTQQSVTRVMFKGPVVQRDRGTHPMPERNNMMGHHISVKGSGSPVSSSNHLRVHSHRPKGLLVKTPRPTGTGWTVLHPNSYVEALTSSTL